MKYVLFYEPGEDAAKLAPVHFPEHRARWQEFAGRGSLLAIGPFTDGTGAMGVFTTRADAEAFAGGDPFVQHGVVRGWSVREWNEALL
ncbi:MAG TPA: YciI family protein [Streptosporangiaceae bacterium]|nr:YciI family protein [Streptosporangiaceae bacterium]